MPFPDRGPHSSPAVRRLVLVRHGETVGGSTIRLFGATDLELSELGRSQARRVAAALVGEGFEAVYASPMRRAVEFAALALPGRIPTLVPGLREIDFGDWEGLTWDEVAARDPEGYRRCRIEGAGFTYPGGDSRRGFRERIAAAVPDLFAGTATRVVAVLHKGVIKSVLATLLGRDPESFRDHPVDLGSLHLLRQSEEGWILDSANQVEHLGEDHRPG